MLFGLLVAGVAIGAAFTVSAASLLLFLPLLGGAMMLGGFGFGLSAGAFVLTGIVASAFNLVGSIPMYKHEHKTLLHQLNQNFCH